MKFNDCKYINLLITIISLYVHLGKRSKSSQRIESDSDPGDTSENSDSGEPDDDPEDIQPIGKYGS